MKTVTRKNKTFIIIIITQTLPSKVSGWCVASKTMCSAGMQKCVARLFDDFSVFQTFKAVCPFYSSFMIFYYFLPVDWPSRQACPSRILSLQQLNVICGCFYQTKCFTVSL